MIKELLGDGSLSMVHAATDYTTGDRYAVKIFDRQLLRSQKKEKDVSMEEHALRRLNHPGIVKLFAAFRDEGFHYFVLEHCPGGELWALAKDVGLPDRLARHYLAQVLEAIGYMQDAGIVHRDLKAENVMIDKLGAAKLIDFGTAKDFENPHVKGAGNQSWKKTLDEYVGTPNFMAPEVIKNKSSDFRSEMWSFGCLILQVLSGLPPFFGGSTYRVYKRVAKAQFDVPDSVGAEARDLIGRLVLRNPDARLGAADLREVSSHAFFARDGWRRGSGRFSGAHLRAAPLLSLEELCLRAAGRRWGAVGERAAAWGAGAGPEGLRPEARAALGHLEELHLVLGGKGCEQSTSVSGSDGEKQSGKR